MPTTAQSVQTRAGKWINVVLSLAIVVLLALAARTVYHHLKRAKAAPADEAEPPQSAATSTVAPVSDDFHSTSLNPRWTFIAPCCGFLDTDGTDARLIVPGFTYHDISTAGNRAVRLLQAIGNVDFDVEVKFDSAVTQQYQEQGILVEQDTGNFLRFAIYSNGRTPRLLAASFRGGVPTLRQDIAIFGAAPLWMRIKRAGDLWTQSWSLDGLRFSEVAPFRFHLTAERIGPFAGNAGARELNIPAPSFTAMVDYFSIGSARFPRGMVASLRHRSPP